MYKYLLEIIKCPTCGNQLSFKNETDDIEVIDNTLVCQNNHSWLVKDGIVNFNGEEQTFANNWSEYYKDLNYQELDERIASMLSDSIREIGILAREQLTKKIRDNNYKRILDIATGRGNLLKKMIEKLEEPEIVCVDLSHEVLKIDRLELLKRYPKAQINYIACDASVLPFIDNSFDIATTLSGFQNMSGDLASKSINEALRVSGDGILEIAEVIKEDNPKLPEIEKILIENNIDFDLAQVFDSTLPKIREENGKNKVSLAVVHEGIAERNDADLFPIEGEWYQTVICSIKEK